MHGSHDSYYIFSGLDELLELLFAANVIPHILSGKAYSRALRGHFLIHAAILKLIFDEMLKSNIVQHMTWMYLRNSLRIVMLIH